MVWAKVARRLWIPEFSLTVEGRENPGGKTFTVRFRQGNRTVSVANNVTPADYAYLFVWAHGSVLARLKNWKATQLSGWLTSECIAVSNPPYDAGSKIQILSWLSPNFDSHFYAKHKELIYYWLAQPEKKTSYRLLNANIIHLDCPPPDSIPAIWREKDRLTNLKKSLPQILSPEGIAWLNTCTSDRPAALVGSA
jgi:hypothetical protein